MSGREYYVYAWYFKSSGEIFHIGKGKGYRYKEKKQRRNRFFRNIIEKHSDDVDVKLLCTNLTDEEACAKEIELIAYYKSIGQCKTNFHRGGKGGNTGHYINEERSKKLSEFARTRVGNKNPNYGNRWSEEQRNHLSNVMKELWKENPNVFMTEKRKNTKKTSWCKGLTKETDERLMRISEKEKGRKVSEKSIEKFMNTYNHYKFEVYFNNQLIYWTISPSKLNSFCEQTFKISRTIIWKIVDKKWKPTFNKHKHLETLVINKLDRSVSTMGDECSPVEWRLQPFEVPSNS